MSEDRTESPAARRLIPSGQPFPNDIEQFQVYGYDRSSEILLTMREITFEATPQALRDIATFLNAAAGLLEAGDFNHTHEHIETFVEGWRTRFPHMDIIVLLPALRETSSSQSASN